MIPELNLADPELTADPSAVYGRVREAGPVARTEIPGMGPMWIVTRHDEARAALADPRLVITSGSFQRPAVPDDCLPYLRTMSEMDGPDHARLRRLVAPAFSLRRAAEFRPRIEPIADALLDRLMWTDGRADLLAEFARPLPMDVICGLVGIPESDRPQWREYGAAVAAGHGQAFADAIPGIIGGARAAVARRRAEPSDDLLSDLVRAQAEDGDRLTDTELVTLVWHLVLAGQTPTNLIANAVAALFDHADQLARLRAEPAILPQAVEELLRWCGPQPLAIPRYPVEDIEIAGVRIAQGEPVIAAAAAANRDPRAFSEPESFDLGRPLPLPHLAFGHGPHFCLGASIARVQTEVALDRLLRRYPDLALAEAPVRLPDPGTFRLAALWVTRTAR